MAALAAWQPPQAVAPPGWDYAYVRRPTTSACAPGDCACHKLEALFQNVLHYPRAPAKLCRYLRQQPGGIAAQLAAITCTVQRLSDMVGREIALYLVRRTPWIVLVPAPDLVSRIDGVRLMLGVRGPELLMLLRKNPNLLRMERAVVHSRYEALHDIIDFTPEQVRGVPGEGAPGDGGLGSSSAEDGGEALCLNPCCRGAGRVRARTRARFQMTA